MRNLKYILKPNKKLMKNSLKTFQCSKTYNIQYKKINYLIQNQEKMK